MRETTSYRPSLQPHLLCLLSTMALLACDGCLVPQPRGNGALSRVIEPVTRRAYYLYLPQTYVTADEAARATGRWPLVVTFHGMKPYDIAYYQAREWQQEADRYGYIVVAPELATFDFFVGEFPLRTLNYAFKSDEVATLAILDHVFETTHADPANVLATSWSSGGYLAHYMLNRHPDRFTCLAVRQSNFTANVLDANLTYRSLYHPVLVLGTENDVAICKEETREAIRWYEGHEYRNFAWIHLNRLGHERTPDMAADFFARLCGAQPSAPAQVLTGRQAIDGNPAGLALFAGKLEQIQRGPTVLAAGEPNRAAARRRRPLPVAPAPPVNAAAGTAPTSELAIATPPDPAPMAVTPPRGSSELPVPRVPITVGIRVSAAVGFEPLVLTYAAEVPADWLQRGDFAWYLDGRLIGRGVNGQRTLAQAGDYALQLVVVAPGGGEFRTERFIRVLKNESGAAARDAPYAALDASMDERARRGPR